MYVRSTASEKNEQDKLQPQLDTTLENVQQLSVSLAEFKINIPKINIPIFELNISLAEFNRTPKKTYKNPNIKNETESLISRVTNVTWVQIFPYLDLRALAFLMVSCKKMAHLANDNKTRERLYKSKQHHFFKSFLPKESLFDEIPAVVRLQEQVPVQQFVPIRRQVFNDNPPGRGFVMR